MTFLGCIFIPLGVGVWLFRPRWLLPLAVIAAVFQAGSVLNIREVGVPPYYFVAVLIIVRSFVTFLLKVLKAQFEIKIPLSYLYPLLAFWVWASVSALVMPLVFRGIPIETLELPVSELHLSFANAVQVGWLTLNVGVVLFAARFDEWEPMRKAFALAVGIAVTVMLVQLALTQFGYQFPDWIFNSNPGQAHAILGEYDLGEYDRPNGLFSEPSEAGVLFTALTAGALARYLSGGSIWLFIGSLTCTLLVRSAASLAALAVCCVLLCIAYFPVRKFRYLDKSGARRYAILAVFCFAGIAIIAAIPSVTEALLANTINKSETASFIARTAADFAGLRTFRDTYGFGVGIGSIRTSSFLVTLLATTGVGAVLFIWFVILLLKRTKNSALRWTFLGGLLAQVAGVSELSLPLLWINVCVLTVFTQANGVPTDQQS
jgi:hypothetical protein